MPLEDLITGHTFRLSDISTGADLSAISRLFQSTIHVGLQGMALNLKMPREVASALSIATDQPDWEVVFSKHTHLSLETRGKDADEAFLVVKNLLQASDGDMGLIWENLIRERDEGGQVHKERVVVSNRLGVHARAVAKFVHLARRFEAEALLYRLDTGEFSSLRHMLGTLALTVSYGTLVEIHTIGKDAQPALQALTSLATQRFGEET